MSELNTRAGRFALGCNICGQCPENLSVENPAFPKAFTLRCHGVTFKAALIVAGDYAEIVTVPASGSFFARKIVEV